MSWIDTLDRLITDSWMASRDESAAMLDSLLALSLAERWGLFQSRDPRLMFLADTDYLTLFHSLNAHSLMAAAADRDHGAPVTEEATTTLPFEVQPFEAPPSEASHGHLMETNPHSPLQTNPGHDGQTHDHDQLDHDHGDVQDHEYEYEHQHGHGHGHGHEYDDQDDPNGHVPLAMPPVVRSRWRAHRGVRWLTLAIAAATALMLLGATLATVVLLTTRPSSDGPGAPSTIARPNTSPETAPLAGRLEVIEQNQAHTTQHLAELDARLDGLSSTVDKQFETTLRAVKWTAALEHLQRAVDHGFPFAVELDQVAAMASHDPKLTAPLTRLAGYAAAGVPALAALRDRYEQMAPHLSESEGDPGAATQLFRWFGSGFGLVENAETRHFHGVLAGIGASLRLGDLSAAVHQLQDLRPYPTETVDHWLAAARIRLEADAALDRVRQSALSTPIAAPEQ